MIHEFSESTRIRACNSTDPISEMRGQRLFVQIRLIRGPESLDHDAGRFRVYFAAPAMAGLLCPQGSDTPRNDFSHACSGTISLCVSALSCFPTFKEIAGAEVCSGSEGGTADRFVFLAVLELNDFAVDIDRPGE